MIFFVLLIGPVALFAAVIRVVFGFGLLLFVRVIFFSLGPSSTRTFLHFSLLLLGLDHLIVLFRLGEK